MLDGANLVLENQMTLGGDLECSGMDCPTSTKQSFYDFEKGQICSAGDDDDGDEDGDVCAASVRSCWQIYCQSRLLIAFSPQITPTFKSGMAVQNQWHFQRPETVDAKVCPQVELCRRAERRSGRNQKTVSFHYPWSDHLRQTCLLPKRNFLAHI